jgi:hypothetical protein
MIAMTPIAKRATYDARLSNRNRGRAYTKGSIHDGLDDIGAQPLAVSPGASADVEFHSRAPVAKIVDGAGSWRRFHRRGPRAASVVRGPLSEIGRKRDAGSGQAHAQAPVELAQGIVNDLLAHVVKTHARECAKKTEAPWIDNRTFHPLAYAETRAVKIVLEVKITLLFRRNAPAAFIASSRRRHARFDMTRDMLERRARLTLELPVGDPPHDVAG